MMTLQQVHTHSAPEWRLLLVNKRPEPINETPILNNAGMAVREFPPALVGSKAPDVLRQEPQHAQARAVMVKNAGHSYKMRREGSR